MQRSAKVCNEAQVVAIAEAGIEHIPLSFSWAVHSVLTLCMYVNGLAMLAQIQ